MAFVHGNFSDANYAFCNICKKNFSNKSNLYKHELAIHKREIFQCVMCDHTCYNKSNLAKHISTIHGDSLKYICQFCKKEFSEKANLNKHIKTVHENLKEFECQKCEKKFSLKHHLKKHNLVFHKPDVSTDENSNTIAIMKELPFLKGDHCVCKFCKQKLSDPYKLRRHVEQIHKGVKYVCEDCNKQFSDKSNMKKHAATTHSKLRKFHCSKCHYNFTQKSSLRRHEARMAHPPSTTSDDEELLKHPCKECEVLNKFPILSDSNKKLGSEPLQNSQLPNRQNITSD